MGKDLKNNIEKYFGKLWAVQLIILLVISIYAIVATMSLGLIILNPSLLPQKIINSSFENKSEENFTVTVFFQSSDKNNPITWDPVFHSYSSPISLYKILNSSVNLTGIEYPNLGYYISGINGVLQYDNYYWHIYLYVKGSWVYSSYGASSLIFNSTSFVKMDFSND